MFAAHGDWRFAIFDGIVYVQMHGAINREGVMQFQKEVLLHLAGLGERTFRRAVTDLTDFELSTADSQTEIQTYFAGVKQRGYERIDYIGANSLCRQLLNVLWQDSGVDVRLHASRADFLATCPECSKAKTWLEGSN